MTLPLSVTSRVETPAVTDVALHILRDAFPDVSVTSEIELRQEFPAILVRRARRYTAPRGEQFGLASRVVDINVFTAGEDGDADGEALSEAVRVAFRDAWLNRLTLPADLGEIIRITPEMDPVRSPDWATSQGPVQYADLPTAAWRWESAYRITYRPPR